MRTARAASKLERSPMSEEFTLSDLLLGLGKKKPEGSSDDDSDEDGGMPEDQEDE